MLSVSLWPAISASALDPGFYAEKSVLASGRWAKVKVNNAGMNLITDAQLRNLGFANPQKVKVYGLGGRVLDYGLTKSNHDDLPQVTSIRTSKGLVFFAVDNITWTKTRGQQVTKPFGHVINPYNDDTYYFISDVDTEAIDPVSVSAVAERGEDYITAFTERILHESEIEPAADSGSQVWGEDFRSKRQQTFSFQLPGNSDGDAQVAVRFAAKTVGTSSSIKLTANGEPLPESGSDRILSVEADSYGSTTLTIKKISGAGDKLDLGIEFSNSGLVYKARLDYIEVFYTRRLTLDKGELHFYLDLKKDECVKVAGCTETTCIWDVTDPVRPEKVSFLLDGADAVFRSTAGGYREFVAFEPEKISRGVNPSGMVANQDIHGLSTPDMVIVTLPEYRAGAEKIAAVHEKYDGMRVHVIDADHIYNEFSGGKPDPGAFRRMLKMWYDRGADPEGHKIGYALLMGKPISDNKLKGIENRNLGFKPLPIWESYDGMLETSSYSNDTWLGMLDDVENSYFVMEKARMRVAVGRIPCKSSAEAMTVAEKIEKYVATPDYGDWRNKVMIIADDEDNAVHVLQAEKIYDHMQSADDGKRRVYDRLYLDKYPRVLTGVGVTYPQATAHMMENYNDGVMFTNYIGHAGEKGWGHEHLWEWPSITSMTNKRLTFIYAATCRFAYWDKADVSGAEVLLLNPDGGVVGCLAATRTVYISNNGTLNNETMANLFERASDGGPLRWGDVFVRGQNKVNDTNKLRYALLGDPALRIPGGSHKINVTAIDGKNPHEGQMVELMASSSPVFEGEILNGDGTPAADYNGTVQLQLYDGERVITTYGQGKDGVKHTYNDRDRRLYTATGKVTGGKWKVTMRVPPEIQGLFTTAMLTSYAWDESGREANGKFDRFYVYGYNDNVTDTEGPVIESFYVNRPDLAADAVISSNMMVFARLRDDSSINMSQTGIGHSLTLSVDGKEYVDGLGRYYTQDPEDSTSGTLAFPLNNVAPGRHTLILSAWDNVNNLSKAEIEIEVGAGLEPSIVDLSAAADPSAASVDFRITLDRPNTDINCRVGVYDLSGRMIWEDERAVVSDMECMISTRWDLCDSGGRRVPRGIYIYRVTVEDKDGMFTSQSKKLAVSAQQAAE